MSLVNNLSSIVHSADAIKKRFSSLACSVAFFYLYIGHHARTRVFCIADNGFGINYYRSFLSFLLIKISYF